jgi:hypothetical protein
MIFKLQIHYKNITFCCRDCGNKISYATALYGKGRCQTCSKIGRHHSKETKQKIKNSNKSQKRSKETRLKISKLHKGKLLSKETKIKISKSTTGKNNGHFGKKHSKESRLKISIALKGKKHSLESRLKRSKFSKGKNNSNWRGGISYFPYTKDFSKELRFKIRYRDNFTCQNCKITEKNHIKKFYQVLHIHHINYNKIDCDENNLISVCINCNTIANSNRDYWFAYYTYIIEHFKEHVATF